MLETFDITQYPLSCTFALVHEPSKNIIVYDTINFYKTLGEVLNKIYKHEFEYTLFHDYKHHLSIRVLNKNPDTDLRKQLFKHNIETLISEGYTVLNKKHVISKYVYVNVHARFKGKPCIFLCRTSARKDKTILGIFNNVMEVDNHIQYISTFSNTEAIPEVYAYNADTVEYLKSHLKIPLRL